MEIVYIVCVNSSLKHNDVIYEKLSIPITKRNDFKYIAYLWGLKYGLYTEVINNTFTTQYENNGKFIIVYDINAFGMSDINLQ